MKISDILDSAFSSKLPDENVMSITGVGEVTKNENGCFEFRTEITRGCNSTSNYFGRLCYLDPNKPAKLLYYTATITIYYDPDEYSFHIVDNNKILLDDILSLGDFIYIDVDVAPEPYSVETFEGTNNEQS